MIELYDGLDAASQNRWPSLKFDVQSINGLMSPFFGAGFYYKTFMWPANVLEETLRARDPAKRRTWPRRRRNPIPTITRRPSLTATCWSSAEGPPASWRRSTAGRAGARVILSEEDFMFGGRLLSERLLLDGKPAWDWLRAVVTELRGLDNVTLMPRTTIFGVYDGGTYGAVERVADHVPVPGEHRPRQRSWHIAAKRAVLASGAIERGIAFAGNDRPGVMLGSAVRSYLNRFAVVPGTRSRCVHQLRRRLDARRAISRQAASPWLPWSIRGATASRSRRAGPWPIFAGAVVKEARGGQQLRSVVVRDDKGAETEIACDLLAVSDGWNPTLHLTCHLGGKPAWQEALAAFVPGSKPKGMDVAGAAAGHFSLAEALAEWRAARR